MTAAALATVAHGLRCFLLWLQVCVLHDHLDHGLHRSHQNMSAQVRENLQYPVVDVQEVHAIVEILQIFLRVRRLLEILARFPFNVKRGF